MTLTLIFPHQLFRNHPALDKTRTVVLVEEFLFFRQYNFHKQKLCFHRASMQFYREWLEQQGFRVRYVESTRPESDLRRLLPLLRTEGVQHILQALHQRQQFFDEDERFPKGGMADRVGRVVLAIHAHASGVFSAKSPAWYVGKNLRQNDAGTATDTPTASRCLSGAIILNYQ